MQQYIPASHHVSSISQIIAEFELREHRTPTCAEIAHIYGKSKSLVRATIRTMGGLVQRDIHLGKVWQTIPSYPAYESSDMGEIRRRVPSHKHRAGSLLAVSIGSDGYPYVSLCLNPKDTKHYRLNRLVCEAFHGAPPSPEYQAAHENGNILDCRPDNLSWKTARQNNADKIRHGTDPVGVRNPRAKLSDACVRKIRSLLASGWSGTSVAEQFDVGATAISCIKLGKSWRHVADAAP